eukprot:s150_g16.t1
MEAVKKMNRSTYDGCVITVAKAQVARGEQKPGGGGGGRTGFWKSVDVIGAAAAAPGRGAGLLPPCGRGRRAPVEVRAGTGTAATAEGPGQPLWVRAAHLPGLNSSLVKPAVSEKGFWLSHAAACCALHKALRESELGPAWLLTVVGRT